MRRLKIVVTLSILVLLSTAYFPLNSPSTRLQQELEELTGRGLAYQLLNNEWLEVENPLTRQTIIFPLDPLLTPRHARYRDLPTLTIDLREIDTSLYSWKYRLLNEIPVTAVEGYALPYADIDGNGQVEVYGIYQSETAGGTRIYELQSDNSWVLQYSYPFQVGVAENFLDADGNGLVEVQTHNADSIYLFEQPTSTSYPVVPRLQFRLSHDGGYGIPVEAVDLEEDGLGELVYRGSEKDSLSNIIQKTYVSEYDSTDDNFQVKWSAQLPPECLGVYCALNMSIGDYDADGLQDFVTSAFMGNVYIVEYVTHDSFSVVWSDSLSTAGRVGGGDVDGNGLEEFFVGGIQLEIDGYWHFRIQGYERTGDNSYQAVSIIDIFPVGFFAVEQLLTIDIDGDGQKELLVSFGGGDMIIKGDGPHRYSLFYYKAVSASDGFSAGDVTGGGIPQLFVSRFYSDTAGLWTHTEVYQMDSSLVAGVTLSNGPRPSSIRLYQNYPNPFNPTTTITYELPYRTFVRLIVFDLNGREIERLVEDTQSPGVHRVQWSADGVKGERKLASGIVFFRLTTDKYSISQKGVLIK